MKILHIVPSYKPAYTYGGTIESVAKLCEVLSQTGEDVTVFTTTANGEEELTAEPGAEYIVDGVRVFYFKRQTKDHSHISFSLWKKLYQECKNYDVVHIHSWWNILVLGAAWICKRRKIKTIISPHGMLSNYIINHSKSKLKNFIHSIFGKSLLKYSIFHATSTAEFLECKKLIPSWQGFILPNILWFPDLHINKNENAVFTIIFLSRIHPKKGIELLMEAISKSSIQIKLQIAGSGEEKYIQGLKQKIKGLRLEERVEWLGWKTREEKFEVMMHADLFALTSYNENFANAVIESLYAGTPVLVSKCVGVSDFVQQQDLGWICEPVVDDVKEKIEEAYRNTTKRFLIHTTSQATTEKYFSLDKLSAAYIEAYRNIVNDKKTEEIQSYNYN